MNRDAFVNAVYLLAEGELPDFGPGDEEYDAIVATGNMKIDEWANETDWSSLYDPEVEVGTVTAGTKRFELPDELRTISTSIGDNIIIRTSNGQEFGYDLAKPESLWQYGGSAVAKQGNSILFPRAFEQGSQQVGGTLYVPGYVYPDKLTSPGSTVPVDDPNWLVKITAAEIVRKDIVNQGQYSNLVAEANALMDNMKRNNEAQLADVITPWSPSGRSW